MTSTLRRLVGLVSLAAAALTAAPAHAYPYSSMVVFGDSLSDTGNVAIATGGAVPATPPYAPGRFSDGPIWVDVLATGLGLPMGAVPSLAGGTNYAFGGARTGAGVSPVPGLLAQFGGLWAPANPLADANALYVVVGGGNDMRDARFAFPTDSLVDQAGRQAAAEAAANNLFTVAAGLAARGARHVLIGNLPDLGATPEAALLGLTAASSDATARYNALLAGFETGLEALFPALDVVLLDLFGLSNQIRDDAINNGGATYGITNVGLPCGSFAGSAGDSCATSLFSDALHPTSAAHAIVGAAALRAVPEPGVAWLALAGLAMLTLQRRRRT